MLPFLSISTSTSLERPLSSQVSTYSESRERVREDSPSDRLRIVSR